MIQNLENKMELQINSLETRNEKMQEKFNKDLEETKNSQSIMNNAITEIKSTLEGTNRLQAEDRISEVEDRMIEINEAERRKEKKIEMRTTSETSGTMLKAPTFESQESQMKKTKRKAMRKSLRR